LKHRASPAFWSLYYSLPPDIQRTTDRSYEHLKRDPRHPSLHFKKVGRFWSARVGQHYRALAVESGEDLIWFWIGTHAEYDKLVG
ncbi:MAG: hypothetical protein ACREJ6_13195, partial [Candidatus Methylomirabilis sp.]